MLRRSDAWRTQTLVRLAASRGFVDAETRQSAWPRVCGIAEIDKRAFRDAAQRDPSHADAAVVRADCARSLWAFTSAWREADREDQRVKLRRVIDGAVNAHFERRACPRYFQGFHDVCAVLLLNCGEKIACAVAERLAVFHLRDATRRTVVPLLDSLSLLPPLLEAVDPEVHAHVFGARWAESAFRDAFFRDVLVRAFLLGEPREPEAETHARAGLRRCVFAVAWQMTWHVHGIGDLCGGTRIALPPETGEKSGDGDEDEDEKHAAAARADAFRLSVASRLVDFFLTTHPAMPLYVGVEAILRNRAYLLTVGRDEPAELHVALSKLRVAPDWRPSSAKRMEKRDDDDDDDDDDATESAAFAALETSLASARELFHAYPPDAMYRRARVEPPAGCAHAKYPYPWLKHDASAREKSNVSSLSLTRAPLPPEVFHEDRDGGRALDSNDDGAWRRSPPRTRKALALRARLNSLCFSTTPPALGALVAAAVAHDLASAETIERAFVFKVADACTDPIFRELLWFLVAFCFSAARGARDGCIRFAKENVFAAVAAVSVSIARGSSLKGVLATADRWLSAASRAGRFANASWYARSRAGATTPRKIARSARGVVSG